jgi:magnesium-transporting ATPase (P-type)
MKNKEAKTKVKADNYFYYFYIMMRIFIIIGAISFVVCILTYAGIIPSSLLVTRLWIGGMIVGIVGLGFYAMMYGSLNDLGF